MKGTYLSLVNIIIISTTIDIYKEINNVCFREVKGSFVLILCGYYGSFVLLCATFSALKCEKKWISVMATFVESFWKSKCEWKV